MNHAHRLAANNGGIKVCWYRCSTWQRKSCRCAACAWRSLCQEQSLGKASGAIEQIVIEDGVFIIDAGTGTNDSLSASGWIPRETCRWTKVMSGNADAIAQSLSPEIQNVSVTWRACCHKTRSKPWIELRARNRRYVGIGASCVTYVTHAKIQGEVRPNLPGIANVALNSIIRSQAAARKTESRFL